MTEKPTDQMPKSRKAGKTPAAGSAKGPKKAGGKAASEAYLVLARKYRPKDFSELIGQEPMVKTLANAFASNRIAQSYMLSGVRGVGKTTTARILARALNYETDKIKIPTIGMKEEGDHCRAIMEGTHVDVIEMDAASHTGIDDIREIIEAARYKPVAGRYKVYIIDEVHMLSKSAFNGLLKTLEEPPEHVKFIFATTELRKVPVTVLSRCQRFDLRRVKLETLQAHFASISAAEKIKITEDALSLIARAAEGSVRDGLSLLDQAFARAGKAEISRDDIRTMLGLADESEILALLNNIFNGEAEVALSTFREFYNKGGDPQQIISELAAAVHAITCEKVMEGHAASEARPEAAQQAISQMAAVLSHAVLHRAWQTLLKGYDEVGAAPEQLIAAEMIILRFLYMGDMPSPGDLVKAISQMKDTALAPPKTSDQNPAKNLVNELKAEGELKARGQRPGREASGALSLVYEHENLTHEQPDDAPEPARRAASANLPQLERFEDLISLVGQKREVKLKLQLEEYAELVNFAPGRIELHMLDGAEEGFITDLSNKLAGWTGTRWMVALSHERGQPTIASLRRAAEQKELEQIRAHPVIEETLKTFPGAEITSIKPITKETEEDDTR